MHRLCTVVVVGLVMSAVPAVAQTASSQVAEELIAVVKAEWAAGRQKNVAEAMKNIANDCTQFNSDAATRFEGKALLTRVSEAGNKDPGTIDPVLDFDPIAWSLHESSLARLNEFITDKKLRLHYVVDTHIHADHVTGMQYFKERYGVPLVINSAISKVQTTFKNIFDMRAKFRADGSQFDVLLKDGDVLKAGRLGLEVMTTPGHTPACTTYKVGDALFTGDAIFCPDVGTGRCDFPNGSARDLYNSVTRKIYTKPDDTKIFPGHDYPGSRPLLNWLRVLAILAIFVFHCTRLFDTDDWGIKNPTTYLFVDGWKTFASSWGMPLILIISGGSVFYTLGKVRPGKYIKGIFLRLFVPLMVGMFTHIVLQVYLENRHKGTFSGSFFEFYPHYFDGMYGFGGNFAWMGLHLWYLEILFILSLLFLPPFYWLRHNATGQRVLKGVG